MQYRIVQYLQPWEIDNFQRQVDKMIESSYTIDKSNTIIWDVTLNLSIVDWNQSQMSKQYFIDKFKYLETIVGYYFTAEFDMDESIQGSGDKKRVCAEKEQDYSIWLDSDIFFPVYTLPLLIATSQTLVGYDDRAIITPEIVRWWDASWDCIVNKKYITEPHEFRMSFDIYSLDSTTDSEFSIKKLEVPKFGAGWFTMLAKKVTDEIKIPIEGGPYGVDDTYFMICGQALGIKQYVTTGVTIAEMSTKFLTNKDYIKGLLHIKIKDKQVISQDKYNELIRKFINEHKCII